MIPAEAINPERDELADLIASVTIDTKSGDVLRVHPDGYRKVCCPDPLSACSECP